MSDDAQLRSGLATLADTVEITLHAAHGRDSALEQELDGFAESLRLASAKIAVSRVADAATGAPLDTPVLAVEGRIGTGRILYHAVPEGPELPPFIEALVTLSGASVAESASAPPGISELRAPAELVVFMAPTCPHCPGAVRAALALALSTQLVNVSIVDAVRLEDLAESFGVRSVPTTVIDRGPALVGVVTSSTLLRHLIERGTAAHEGLELRSLVEAGRLEEASSLLGDKLGARKEFLAWWRESTLSERIQLMLVAEGALELSTEALDDIVAELVNGLPELEDASLRGDTADLLGRIGHSSAIDAVRQLISDSNPDVAEIAEEVLEELESGGRHAD